MTKRFSGLGVALITPFNDQAEVDYPGLERMVHHVAGSKAHFLVVLGSTGEAHLLSVDEQRRVLDFVREVNADRLPLVAGFDSSGGTKAAAERLSALDASGLSGLLISAPAYIRPGQAGLIDHFKALDAVSPLPIVLYNVPSRTGVNLQPETIVELAHSGENIVALKQAHPDLEEFRAIRAGVPADFLLLSGDDASAIPMMALGGDGLVSVLGNAYPDVWAEAMDLALFGSVREAEAMLTDQRMLMEIVCEEGNPTGIKAICELLGLCRLFPRSPLQPATQPYRDALYRAMADVSASAVGTGETPL